MERFKGTYHGANIFGEGGADHTSLSIVDKGDNSFFLTETDMYGAVVRNEKGIIPKKTLKYFQMKDNGIKVEMGEDQSVHLKNGEKLEVKVGSHTVTIEGTDDSAVKLEGVDAPKETNAVRMRMYPSLM